MKKYLLLSVLCCLFFGEIYAQKVSVKKDIILVDEKEYALLKSMTGGAFSLQTLGGKELVIFKRDNSVQDAILYEVIFRESGEKALIEGGLIGDKKLIAKRVVENDLIKGEALNPEGESRFLQLYPYKAPQSTSNVGSPQNANYTLVERDRQAMIFVEHKNIRQGGVVIGSHTQQSVYSQENGNQFSYKIYLPNGTLVAEALFADLTSTEGTCITTKDNKRHYIRLKSNLDTVEEIAKLLIELYYL